MVRERLDVVDDLDGFVGGCVATHAAREGDGLAGDLAVEGAEDELGGGGAVEDVEAWWGVLVGLRGEEGGGVRRTGPVHVRERGGERFVGVPEEGGGVCEVAVGGRELTVDGGVAGGVLTRPVDVLGLGLVDVRGL